MVETYFGFILAERVSLSSRHVFAMRDNYFLRFVYLILSIGCIATADESVMTSHDAEDRIRMAYQIAREQNDPKLIAQVERTLSVS